MEPSWMHSLSTVLLALNPVAALRGERLIGTKRLAVVTGTSSGLGRKTAQSLLRTGQYHVVGAVRDLEKMEIIADADGFDPDSFTAMHVELNDFSSVRKFVDELKDWKGGKHIDRLVCNAGVYQPSLPYAKWSADGHEQTMQINYLSHFLLTSLLLEDLAQAPEPRCIYVGSVTGNDNTVGGGGVYPIADLKELEGLKAGFKNPVSMIDGYNFDGAKAYKDSKLALMMTSNILHDKFHKQTGISFSSIYPGCIAESPLFREKRAWFRKYFPLFMKYITGGYVGEEEAGMRLMQVSHDPRCIKSGVYWSWNGGPREGRGEAALENDGQIEGGGGAGGGWDSIFENDQSDKVLNRDMAADLFKHSTLMTGAEWPEPNQPAPPDANLQLASALASIANFGVDDRRSEPRPGMVGGMADKILAERAAQAKVQTAVTLKKKLRKRDRIKNFITRIFRRQRQQKDDVDADALMSKKAEALLSDGGMPVSLPKTKEELVRSFVAATERGDAAAAMKLCTDDLVYKTHSATTDSLSAAKERLHTKVPAPKKVKKDFYEEGCVIVREVEDQENCVLVREIEAKPIPIVTVSIRQEFEVRGNEKDGWRLSRAEYIKQ